MGKIPIAILAVDDEETLLEVLKRILQSEGYYVHTAADGAAAINILQTLPFDLVLLDIKMPEVDGVAVLRFIRANLLDTQVIMLSASDEIDTAVECMKLGAYDYLQKPHDNTELLAAIDRALERKRLLIENKALRIELARRGLSPDIVTQTKAMLEVLDLATRAAPTDSAVLIQGESGTGKELVADFLHRSSVRREKPLLALGCSSISETLLESELFGHERGAFPGATGTKQGLLEIANGGTLLLDDVGEIPAAVQPKLLRFLQSGEFHRLGGQKVHKSDVRVISTTEGDLRNAVSLGKFREDLLFRLNVITLQLPPLRDRREDISLLVDHFLQKRAAKRGRKQIEEKALEVLMKYDWPGNVRELENVIERAAVFCQGEKIHKEDLALPMRGGAKTETTASPSSRGIRAGSSVSLKEMEKAHIDGVLKSVNWQNGMAAKILGIGVKTLSAKIRGHKLSKPK
jgi:two-component system NtrC family response regulator